MALVVPDQGELIMLHYIVGLVSAGNPVLQLYRNNVTGPDDNTERADLNLVTSAGYSAITLGSTGWTTTQAGSVTTAIYSEVTFSFTTDAQVYGYFVTDSSDALLWVEEFSGAPFQIPDGGGTISITSKITLS